MHLDSIATYVGSIKKVMLASRPLSFSMGLAVSLGCAAVSFADVTLPNIFTDHMVLQRDQENKLWGKAEAGEAITATIAGQTVKGTTAADGNWSLVLPKLPASGTPLELVVAGKNTLTVHDILVGEVWICSGQSNMQWSVYSSNDADLELLASNYPNIRMINYPNVGTQEPVWTHDRAWQVSNPKTVGSFSAVGYFFARQLNETLGVPIGMINNAWGGSAVEAWVDRKVLESDPDYAKMIADWSTSENEFKALAAKTDLDEAGKKRMNELKGQMGGNFRPGNIYNGVLSSHIGYGIRGAIWYQGESNSGRAYQYRKLFPKMIANWRERWGQGDFPFYYVQLADFMDESPNPAESAWAELREAQTMTMAALPKTGQAVIIDIGEGKDIHPKNKVDVARRLARWALANDYGVAIPFRSPQYKGMQAVENKIALTFDYAEGGWRPFDVATPVGFQIAGDDHKFVWAQAAIQQDGSIHVSSPDIAKPVAVRYAWANNPKCNMYAANGLPLTPFRTDDWPGVTVNNLGR